MKKSNLLLGAAVVFFLACLLAFNFTWKQEYQTGNYKDPYSQHVALAYSGFTEVEVNGTHMINVRISKGPHQVRIHDKARIFLEFIQVGEKLLINVNRKEELDRIPGDVLISLPELSALTVTSMHTVAGQRLPLNGTNWHTHSVSVEGFIQDSMSIFQDHANETKLAKNKLGNLQVQTGAYGGGTSRMVISSSNTIQKAHFDIQDEGTLALDNVIIPELSYQFSDSAKVEFIGTSLQLLNKK